MRAMARALELGVDFWDTANVYGEGLCETLIGKFLAEDRARRGKSRSRPNSPSAVSPTGRAPSTTARTISARASKGR